MNNIGKSKFVRRAERCEFLIFSVLLRALSEAHALSLQLDPSWARRRDSTLHDGLVVWGVHDVRGSAALTSLRTPGLQTEKLRLKPMALMAWLLAPNPRERKQERRLVLRHIPPSCFYLKGSIEQAAGLVQVLPPLECLECIGLL